MVMGGRVGILTRGVFEPSLPWARREKRGDRDGGHKKEKREDVMAGSSDADELLSSFAVHLARSHYHRQELAQASTNNQPCRPNCSS